MKPKILLLLYFFTLHFFAQHEADNWIFGVNAGVSFQSGNPVSISSSMIPMNTMEGCATISDANGNLLFYVGASNQNATSLTVWTPYDIDNNGIHDIMQGGNSLIGDVSSTQAALIVPKPGDANIYYIFTVDKYFGNTPNNNRGLHYYTVDMSLDSGRGAVVGGGVNLLDHSAEKVTAVKSDDCESIWVISYSSNDVAGSTVNNQSFHAFQVSPIGVNTTQVISVSGLPSLIDGRGYLKVSPDGTKLAMAQTVNGEVILFDFDNATGVVSNGLQLNFPIPNYTYGLEFSKDSKRLYVTTYDPHSSDVNTPNDGYLYQFDLDVANPENTAVLIDVFMNNLYRTALQLAPDGKIYQSMPEFWGTAGGSQYLSVINNPEALGVACNYVRNAVDLGMGRSHQGLPPFIQSLFVANLDIIHQASLNTNVLNLCTGDQYTLFVDNTGLPAGTTYEWTQNGNPIPVTSSTMTIDENGAYQNGTYEVTVTFPNNSCPQIGNAVVTYFVQPIANPVNDWLVCDTDNNGFFTFDLSSLTPTILGTQNPTEFTVTYHSSLLDAQNDVNPLPLSYTNPIAYQDYTIYARIENNACNTCFDITDFEIDVFNSPTAHQPNDMLVCDDATVGTDTDGIHSFNLNAQNATVLGTQPSAQYEVTYHLSLLDADNDANALSSPYQNISNPQPIFVRIENRENTNCYATTQFEIIVNALPVIAANPVVLEQCDDDLDGYTPFNLNEVNSLISTNYLNETFTFYTNQSDALLQQNAINNPTAYINPTQPTSVVWANIENSDGCSRVKEFTLTVSTTQIPSNLVIQYENCDNLLLDNDDFNGITPFDLTAAHAQIESLFPNPQNITITFYENMTDALAEQNSITNLANYQNINYPHHQFITVRVDSQISNACLGLGEHIELTVHPLPVYPSNVSDIEVCSASNTYGFDLNSKNIEILNGQPDISVTYHAYLSDAQFGNNPLASPYNNFSNPQTIYVRMVNNITGCLNAYGNFNIKVNSLPINGNSTNFEVCDDALQDGFTSFNISDKTAEILASQTGITVTYYLTLTDASNGVNPLIDGYINISNPQTIHFRMENETTHCVTLGNFDLIVHAAPIVYEPSPIEVCDPDSDGYHHFNLHLKDSEIAGALVGQVNVTYHETLEDTQLGITDIPDFYHYNNIQAWSQIIYVRVENIVTGCFDTTSLELIVNPTPQINFFPEDYELCDDNYNGYLAVDLSAHLPEILGSVSASDVQVSYHHSAAEAWAEVNPIVNYPAYTNTSNPQTFWVRVEYAATNCASVVSFDLVINPLPVLNNSFTLSLCDNDHDGEDNNGFVQNFELHDMDNSILNGQTGIVTYHYTQADAQSGSNSISDPFTNSVPFVQTLWVRVENNVTGCYATTNLDVRVNPLPTPGTPDPLEACDADADGFTQFDLTDAALIQQIQNGEAGTAVTFHETYADAENKVNYLASPFTNFSTANASQIIYARDEFTATGCYRVVPVLLTAHPSPQIQTPDNLEVCDDNYDHQMSFDLNEVTAQILGSIDPTTVTVSYYTSQSNAENATNPINLSQLYTNQIPNQTIWVRVENTLTGCFSIADFQLIVHPLPTVVTPELTMRECDVDATDGVEQALFDLESMNTLLVDGQSGLIVYYFETLAQAETNEPSTWLPSPYANTSNPQTLYVRLQNLNTGCFALTTMDLEVYTLPNLNLSPQTLNTCDDSFGTITDQIGTFDLTEIIGPLTNNQTTVTTTFYLDSFLTQAIDPLTWSNFQNTTPAEQVIYALVSTNAVAPAPICSVTVPITLHVDPQPVPNASGIKYYCMDTLVASLLVDLADLDALVIPDSEDYSISYHLNLADAISGINPLVSPRQMQSGNVLYAHVESAAGCSAAAGPYTVVFAVNPTAGNPQNIEVCDTGNLTESFNLANENEANILNGQTGMTVTFHASFDHAEDNTFPISTHTSTIAPPATSATDTLFARLTNDITHCYSIKSFTITLNALPTVTINAPSGTMYCQHNPIVLSAVPNPTGSYTYTWSLNANSVGATQSISVTDPGLYTLTIVNDKGCSAQDNVNVQESEVSTLQLSNLEITNWVQNNTLTIPTGTEFGSGVYTYAVDQPNGPFSSQLLFENLSGGNHTLYVNDENNCGVIAIPFVILDFMRFFTPNGDGQNDTWNLLGGYTQPEAKIHIFDRFGKLLAVIDPNGEGWDGLYNGFQMPSTDYWFSIELKDGTLKKGHFSLVRR